MSYNHFNFGKRRSDSIGATYGGTSPLFATFESRILSQAPLKDISGSRVGFDLYFQKDVPNQSQVWF